MSAISLAALNVERPGPVQVRVAVAQATIGQTDWILVPNWAKQAEVIIEVSAMTGTTPNLLPQLVSADPITLDDTRTFNVGGFTTTGGITSNGIVDYQVGPGITGIADATAAVATSGASYVLVNSVLPSILGIKVTNFRGSADETYTYKISVRFS